ncbi:MAG TPA: S41 family peptidase [Clostridiaceae bacterium]|nr:S41 family peptidase [Clostridiaceae bacterium]
MNKNAKRKEIKNQGKSTKYIKSSVKIVSVFLILVITVVFNASTVGATESKALNLDYLNSIMELIDSKYAGEVDNNKLLEGVLKGIFGSLDPYTQFYTPEEAKQFFGSVEGSYEGIGIAIEKQNNVIIITKVFPGTPADQAGLIQGDKIISIDMKSTADMTVEEAANYIRGLTGTKVTLGIMRGNSNDAKIVEVERKKIKLNPVTYEIKGDIAYIKLETFNANTEEFFNDALKEIDDKGISKIILDLRDNPGGLVDQGVALARHFVPKGLITKLVFKSEDMPDQEYNSYLENPKYKLVVLVNEMSASASEIVAGAIQDTKAGTIVGTKTYGKAKVQNLLPILTPEAYEKYAKIVNDKVVEAYDLISKHGVNPLNSEVLGWIKITTGYYVTPNNRMIDGEGITPDVIVESTTVVDGIHINSIQKLSLTWKPTLGDDGLDVYNAEKILKLLGYDIGTPDTYLDEKTYSQISKFRTDRGFYAGGVLDFTTQKALNEAYEFLRILYDKQYAKALEILRK